MNKVIKSTKVCNLKPGDKLVVKQGKAMRIVTHAPRPAARRGYWYVTTSGTPIIERGDKFIDIYETVDGELSENVRDASIDIKRYDVVAEMER